MDQKLITLTKEEYDRQQRICGAAMRALGWAEAALSGPMKIKRADLMMIRDILKESAK